MTPSLSYYAPIGQRYTCQTTDIAVGVRDAAEALQTEKFTFPEVGKDTTLSHEYIFVPVGTALSEKLIVSDVAIPLVATVTVVPHAPEAMAEVPSAVVPEAKVVVTVPEEGNVAVELIPVPPLVFPSRPVT